MIKNFVNLLHDVTGPTGFFIMETRVQERVTILNWGVVHPVENKRYLFGVVSVSFDHESDDLWKAGIAQITARITPPHGMDPEQEAPPA